MSFYLVLISTPFSYVSLHGNGSWDDCRDRCQFSSGSRQSERASRLWILSVNTTYLACIVVVFIICYLSVNPKPWLLPLHHHFCLISTSLWTPSSTVFPPRSHSALSPMSPFGLGDIYRTSDTLVTPATSLGWTHRSCMIHSLNPDGTGLITVSSELVSISESHMCRIMDSEYRGGWRREQSDAPCSHVGRKKRNNGMRS